MMMPKTQRDEMIDMANEITELLETLEPFANVGNYVDWEFSKDTYNLGLWQADSRIPLTLGNIKRAMKVYKKYKKIEPQIQTVI